MSNNDDLEKVRSLIKGTRIAMLTHIESDGSLVARPMATQEVEFDGTIRFLGSRTTDQVKAIQQNPRVNVSYSGDGSWVSVSGRARVEHDEQKLKDAWSSFTDAWLEGGPENPDNVIIEIDGDSASYIDAPGDSKVANLLNLIKQKVTGERIEGDSGEVDL